MIKIEIKDNVKIIENRNKIHLHASHLEHVFLFLFVLIMEFL